MNDTSLGLKVWLRPQFSPNPPPSVRRMVMRLPNDDAIRKDCNE